MMMTSCAAPLMPSLGKRRLMRETSLTPARDTNRPRPQYKGVCAQDFGFRDALKTTELSTSRIPETRSSGSSSGHAYFTRSYEPSTKAVAFSDTRVLTQPEQFSLVNHCHPDQLPAHCDSTSADYSYKELVTLLRVATAAGAIVVTTQPERLDWISRNTDEQDGRLLVARMRMVNRGRKCHDGGNKLESMV